MTRGSINEIFAANGFSGEIDLLSLDLDGVDYWIWESIEKLYPHASWLLSTKTFSALNVHGRFPMATISLIA